MSSSRKKLIEIKDLCVNFNTPEGTIQAVRDVSFYIRTGEIIGVVGESGSGKTVTASTLLGWVPGEPGIVSGEVLYYDESEVKHTLVSIPKLKDGFQEGAIDVKISEHELNSRFRDIRSEDFTMIFQEPKRYLHPFWTVQKHFDDILKRSNGISVKDLAFPFLESVGLSQKIWDQYPHNLSGGMNQRLMIALALARQPRLLIADEMTTGLDVTTQVKIAEMLSRLISEAENQNRAIIMISHDIAFIIKIVNVIMVMYAGEIVEFGPADLFYDEDQDDNHPYTNALLDVYYDRNKSFIEGDVPSSKNPPPGCPFRERNCRILNENIGQLGSLCENHRPQKFFINDQQDHWVRCHKFTIEPWSKIVSS